MRKIRLQKYDKVKIGFHYTDDYFHTKFKYERSSLIKVN